jgi:hypothetical protein
LDILVDFPFFFLFHPFLTNGRTSFVQALLQTSLVRIPAYQHKSSYSIMFKQVGAKSNDIETAYVFLVVCSSNLPREKLPTRQFRGSDQLLSISAALSFH